MLHVSISDVSFLSVTALHFSTLNLVAEVQIDYVFKAGVNQLIVEFSAVNLGPDLVLTNVLLPEYNSVF
jgi:hypothetical protein